MLLERHSRSSDHRRVQESELPHRRHGGQGLNNKERHQLGQLLHVAMTRLSFTQLLTAACVASKQHLSNVLSAACGQLQQPQFVDTFRQHPARVAEMLHVLTNSGPKARHPTVSKIVRYIASQFAQQIKDFGPNALPFFCALAHAGGSTVFRGLLEQVVEGVCETAGVRLDTQGRVAASIGASTAADLMSSLSRVSHSDANLRGALGYYVSERTRDLDTWKLPVLAQSLTGGEANAEFALLHSICRQSAEKADQLDVSSLVRLLQVCGRYDLYDEAFLDAACMRLCADVAGLPGSRVADVVYAMGSLKVQNSDQIDTFCRALTHKAQDLSEADLVRCVRGLVRLRHTNSDLMEALVPVIDGQKMTLGALSLSNVISAMSFFSVGPKRFLQDLLHVATTRMHRFTSTSVQHILTALCRQQGRLSNEELSETLGASCAYLATPSMAAQLTPVQALGSLSALARLGHRHLPAVSVLLSALVGRGSDVIWYWAPSVNFYMQRRSLPRLFDEDLGVEHLRSHLDTSHCVEILQAIHRLDLYGAFSLRLCALLWKHVLQPQLHELRAREILLVARAMGACHVPGIDQEAHAWKDDVVVSCVENLRRHEHFLEASWFTLLPLKLLCMEIELSTYGAERLGDVLNPALYSFVDRLRHMSHEECEINRLRRDGMDDEDEVMPIPSAKLDGPPWQPSTPGDGQTAAIDGCLGGPWGHILTSSSVQGFPVDVLLTPAV